MKTKIYLFAAIATVGMLFSSCDKKELGDKEASLLFTINTGNPVTKAIESQAQPGDVKIDKLQVQAISAAGSVMATFDLNPGEIQAAQGAGHKIMNFPDAAKTVSVKANYTPGTDFNKIVNIQALTSKGAPLVGTGTVNGPAGSDKTATVNLDRAVARIELIGGIAVTNPPTAPAPPALSSNGVDRVNIKNIYINKFREEIGKPAFNGGNDGAGDWEPTAKSNIIANKMSDAIPQTVTAGNKYGQSIGIETGSAAAYHVYAGDSIPQIVLEVEVYETAGSTTPMPGIKFININNFKNGGTDVYTIAANQVYKINLADIASQFKIDPNHPDPGTEDPNFPPTTPTDPVPNAKNVGMTINVTVSPWTIVNITPSF